MKKQTWQAWARACEADPDTPSKLRRGFDALGRRGPSALAALTGTDVRVLNAVVPCFELYACGDDASRENALEAIRVLLPAMQPNTRWIAQELIPFVLDWDDRDRVWHKIYEELR